MLWTKVKIVVACMLALGALSLGAVLARYGGAAGSSAGQPVARADPPNRPEAPPPAGKSADKSETPKPGEKRYAFEMRDRPWSQVLEWYAELLGLAYIGTSKPTDASGLYDRIITMQSEHNKTVLQLIERITQRQNGAEPGHDEFDRLDKVLGFAQMLAGLGHPGGGGGDRSAGTWGSITCES